MNRIRTIMLLVSLLAFSANSWSEGVSRELIKGLDEQVQDIKKDVLAISAELSLLEEKLLYPSNTQVSLFISLAPSSQYVPDAIKIKINNKPVAHHIYSFKEVGALQKGGVQRIYTGNLRTGDHQLDVQVIGRNKNSQGQTSQKTFKISKGVGAKLVELNLGADGAVVSIKEQ